MSRHRYERLLEAEAAGRLQLGDTPLCPVCSRRFCCHYHNWVYRKWWENTKPHIITSREVMRRFQSR